MSWLSDLFGSKKIKMPSIRRTEMEPDDFDYGLEHYLSQMSKKSGFLDTILTGRKKPKLGANSLL